MFRSQNSPRAIVPERRVLGARNLRFPNSAGFDPDPDVEELPEMGLEARGEAVQGGIPRLSEEHHAVVLPEDIEMVPHGLVVETEQAREVGCVVLAFMERGEELRPRSP